VTRLFLVRHAHADWVPDERRPLSAQGRRDAARIAELLAPLCPAAIYTSPAPRAVQTIAPLASRLGLRPVELPALRERELPVQLAEDFAEVVSRSWLEFEMPVSSGESNEAAQARGVHAIRFVVERHEGEAAVVATHGNLLALVVNAFDARYGHDFWRGLSFPDIYELLFQDNQLASVLRVWSVGDRGCPTTRCS
jgi:2,3-bisphosphoglycerate-dependent phosphoglycerate mutase